MNNSVRFNISSIRPESATSFNSNRCETANQLAFNLETEPTIACEPVPDDLKLGSERYGFTVRQGAKDWVSPVQLRAIETWRLGFAVEEGADIEQLGAILESVIDGGVA